jgi:hypothetical protein
MCAAPTVLQTEAFQSAAAPARKLRSIAKDDSWLKRPESVTESLDQSDSALCLARKRSVARDNSWLQVPEPISESVEQSDLALALARKLRRPPNQEPAKSAAQKDFSTGFASKLSAAKAACKKGIETATAHHSAYVATLRAARESSA